MNNEKRRILFNVGRLQPKINKEKKKIDDEYRDLRSQFTRSGGIRSSRSFYKEERRYLSDISEAENLPDERVNRELEQVENRSVLESIEPYLSEREREVLVLRNVYELTIKETAKQINKSSTVVQNAEYIVRRKVASLRTHKKYKDSF